MDLWMDVDTALAEVPVNLLPLLDDTDGKSIEAAVAYNAAGLALYWHFVTTAGAYSVTAVTPTTGGNYDWTDQGDSGVYTIEIPASGGASINNDTEGFGWFTGVATGVLPWRGPVIGFRAAGLNNKLIDDSDFKAIEAAIAYNAAGMALYWHFVTTAGAYTVTQVTPTTGGDYDWTDQGDAGIYTIEIPASGGASINNDTEGFGWFTGKATGVLPWRGPVIGFRAAALNDALIDGGDNLDVNTVQISGDTTAADNAEAMFDGTGYAGGTTKLAVTATGDTNITLEKALEMLAAFLAGKVSRSSSEGVTTLTYKKRDGSTTSFTCVADEDDGDRATTGSLS